MKLIRHHRLLLIALLIVIFIIPSSYAANDETSDLIEVEDSQTAISMVDEETLAANNDYYFNSSLS